VQSTTLKQIPHFLQQQVFVYTLPRTYDSHISTLSNFHAKFLEYIKWEEQPWLLRLSNITSKLIHLQTLPFIKEGVFPKKQTEVVQETF